MAAAPNLIRRSGRRGHLGRRDGQPGVARSTGRRWPEAAPLALLRLPAPSRSR